MEISRILSRVDHTLLKPDATVSQLETAAADAVFYRTASVCIPAYFVKKAKSIAGGKTKICTVTGFPSGYSSIQTKVFESAEAVENGADEVDTVMNISAFKSGDYGYVLRELGEIRKATEGRILKVIVETALLGDEEILRVCELVVNAKADYIKTSTGFSSRGASLKDIELFKKGTGGLVGIKAAGGIRTFEDATLFLEAGADRLGTSALVNLLKKNNKEVQ